MFSFNLYSFVKQKGCFETRMWKCWNETFRCFRKKQPILFRRCWNNVFRNFFRIPLPLFSLYFLPLPAPCPQAEIISSDHPEFARNLIFKNLWFLVYLWLAKKKTTHGTCENEFWMLLWYGWGRKSSWVPLRWTFCWPRTWATGSSAFKTSVATITSRQLFPRSVRWMTNSCFSPVHLFSSPSLQQTWWWRWFTYRLKARSSPETKGRCCS